MLEANYDEVICPNCVTQFRAIPVNVQNEITALKADRDAYEKCADTMAAAHKVERDALKAELARPESTVVSLMRAENAALKDAARLALDALGVATTPLSKDRQEVLKTIAALKAVL